MKPNIELRTVWVFLIDWYDRVLLSETSHPGTPPSYNTPVQSLNETSPHPSVIGLASAIVYSKGNLYLRADQLHLFNITPLGGFRREPVGTSSPHLSGDHGALWTMTLNDAPCYRYTDNTGASGGLFIIPYAHRFDFVARVSPEQVGTFTS